MSMYSISEQMIRSVMKRYTREQVRWHYEHGLVLQSIFLFGLRTGQDEFCSYVRDMYDTKITDEGGIISYRENEFNLDQINAGKTLFLLHKKYSSGKYLIAIEKLRRQLRNHPRTHSGGFWHKQIYPWQMWLDGLYMQGPFYAQYIAEMGNVNDFDDLAHQFILMEEKAREPATGLLYHAWDESREQLWANKETGCSPHFWGRAVGWYCMALADVLEIIPGSRGDNYQSLKEIALRLIDPLLKYQDPASGLWYQVLDKGTASDELAAKNYTESSASSMFVYFLSKLLRLGVIASGDTEKVKAAAAGAYQGLLRHKVQEDADGDLHLTDICKVAGLGGTPYRDGSYEYYISEPIAADDFKGVGPFILASMEQGGIV